jgi:hypothetical protein
MIPAAECLCENDAELTKPPPIDEEPVNDDVDELVTNPLLLLPLFETIDDDDDEVGNEVDGGVGNGFLVLSLVSVLFDDDVGVIGPVDVGADVVADGFSFE